MIKNHYGYGLRNDEKPFAHKIPPGGNWRDLSHEEQLIYWNGKIPTEGGSTNGLRRKAWSEPAGTLGTTPLQKLSCQLHPGAKDREVDDVVANHKASKLPVIDAEVAKHIPDGGTWKDVPYELLPERLKKIRDNMAKYHSPAFYSRATWDEPAGTVSATMNPTHCQALPPTMPLQGGYTPTMKPLLDSLPALLPNGKRLVSLFSGGGLLDLGFIHAGYEIVFANDFEKTACVAYRHNIGDHIVHGDITSEEIQKLIPLDGVDGVIGGPSCQSWSVAGKGEGDKDPRGQMIWAYMDIIKRVKPKFFLFENVKGIITKRHRPVFDSLISEFEEIGYRVTWEVKNAWDYGVAQKRERVFIVGIREDLEVTFQFPQSEYEATGYRPVLRDAIGDLPEPLGTELSSKAHDYLERDPRHLQKHHAPTLDEASPTLPAVLHKGVPYGLFYPDAPNHEVIESIVVKPNNYAQRNYQAEWDKPARTVNVCRLDHGEIHPGLDNHVTNPLTEAQYNHAKDHQIGYNNDMDKPAYTIRAKSENILDVTNHHGAHFDNVGCNPTWEHANREANREANLDAPAPTRTEKDRCDGINPINGKPRRFTVRECLRIMSVPDSYVFPDDWEEVRQLKKGTHIRKVKLSLSAQYKIVGNGVPSRMAYHFAVAIGEQLDKHQ